MRQYTDNNGNQFHAEKLKPCPFCGCDAKLHIRGNKSTKSRKAIIKCSGCRVQRTDGALKHGQEWVSKVAIRNWNKRIKDSK